MVGFQSFDNHILSLMIFHMSACGIVSGCTSWQSHSGLFESQKILEYFYNFLKVINCLICTIQLHSRLTKIQQKSHKNSQASKINHPSINEGQNIFCCLKNIQKLFAFTWFEQQMDLIKNKINYCSILQVLLS